MFKDMRLKKRKISDSESYEILKEGKYGVLSTMNTDGYAYGIPISYVSLDNNIYFHCALKGSKLENIEKNNKVSFCVVGETEIIPEKFTSKYESVVVFGKAVEVYDEEKETALIALLDKYSTEYMDKGRMYVNSAKDKTKVMKIIIEHISGKASK